MGMILPLYASIRFIGHAVIVLSVQVIRSGRVVRVLAGPKVILIWWRRRSGTSSMTSGDATPSRGKLVKANAATVRV